MTSPSQDKFKLAGGDADFGSRAQNVFAGLESLEAQHVAVESSEAVRRESYALMKPDPSDDFLSASSGLGDSSKFQVPSRPPPKRIHSTSSRPGYETSPSKWKRYDLSDVSASQLTEQSNQAAAHDFLRRFRVQPHDDDATTVTDVETDHDVRHVFRKPDKTPESDDGAKWPVNVKRHEMEDAEVGDVDETEDVTRTQILSFDDDEPNDSGRTVDVQERFRRRTAKPTSGRRVRSQIPLDDDEDEDEEEEEDVNHTVRTGHDVAGDGELLQQGEDSHRAFDSDSNSDHFSELAQLGSDSDPDEDCSRVTKSHSHPDSSASDTEKYAPEDVDLDSID